MAFFSTATIAAAEKRSLSHKMSLSAHRLLYCGVQNLPLKSLIRRGGLKIVENREMRGLIWTVMNVILLLRFRIAARTGNNINRL